MARAVSVSIIYQFKLHDSFRLCLASVHLPHPFHLILGVQLFGHAVSLFCLLPAVSKVMCSIRLPDQVIKKTFRAYNTGRGQPPQAAGEPKAQNTAFGIRYVPRPAPPQAAQGGAFPCGRKTVKKTQKYFISPLTIYEHLNIITYEQMFIRFRRADHDRQE